ncbi:MAK10-like protein [Tanacetum coccineum]
MGDENPIRTLGDYSKPSHEGYRNTIELPVRNNVVPLRSDAIRLVQNGCSFHGLRSEDPNQHLKDFLKLVNSLDFDGENRERTRLHLFQFSLRDQASNWLERLPAGSITTWEDLTTRFLSQFFSPGRTAKLRNDILMFQQHHGESLSEAWTRFKDLLQKVPHHGIDLWLQVQIFYDHVNPVTRRTIDQSAGGKLRDHNAEESWALLEDLALYDNKSWNDPRDFAKPVKAIALPQDVPSTSDHRLIEIETQVQRLMEAHLAPTQPTQVNKIITSCEVCSGPHDTHNCMKVPEKTCVDYTSSRANKIGGKRLTPNEIDTEEEDVSSTNACDLNLGGMVKGKEGVKEQGEEDNEIETDMEVGEVIEEEESEFETDEEVEEILEEEEDDKDGENFNLFTTMKELTHHAWLLKNPRPPWVKARIRAGSPNNIKISCMIMTCGLRSRQRPSNPDKISNFVGRVRRLKIFIGSFAYECDCMILEDTTSIIDRRLGEMIFGKPFIDETGLVYNEEEGTVMFEQDDKKITFKMPHTMEILKQTKLMGLSTDFIPLSAHEGNFGNGRTHYH